jgi:hypothetical protein
MMAMTDIAISSAAIAYPAWGVGRLDFVGKFMILLQLHTFSRMLSIIAKLGQSRNLRVWVLVGFAGLCTFACDKLPLLAPQQSTISLSSGNSVVQANGTTEIRATVLEQSGTPVQNGTTVTFSTNLGALSPIEARTMNGVATVRFLGNGDSGKATIKAISGGAASEALEISVGAAAAGRVSLTANPISVPSTGGTTMVTAVVVDASGNALGGVPVTFSTTAGSLTSQVVNTDSSGRASTNLNTSREATVTATVAAGGTGASATLTITISARPTVSIALAAGSTPVEGGITTFSITVNTGTGGAPLQNVVVSYGDGSSDDLGSVTGTISVQHVYGSDGSFTPSISATDSSGATASASTVIVVQPLLVSINASPAALVVTFTANVSPAGSSIASFTWDFGDGTTLTTSSNSVTHTYAAAKTYTVKVTARAATDHTATATATVKVS